ncbi:MAG: putative membrane protein [Crocinitomix sp.]
MFSILVVLNLISDRKIIIGLILVQMLLCFLVMDKFPISLDEPFSIFHSQQNFENLFQIFENENNPPLHFVFLHFWIKLFGGSIFALRSLGLLISLISIVCLYKFGRKFWKKEYAILLVSLFIFSRLDHYVAMEVRMYGLFTLFFILVITTFYSFLFENKRTFIQLGIWNAMLLYTHYLGGVVIVMEGLVFLFFFSSWTKSKLSQGVLALCVGVVFYIPGISIFMNRVDSFKSNGSWVAPAEIQDLWSNLVKLLNNEFTLFVTVALVILSIILGKRKKDSDGSKTHLYFGFWFIGGYLLMFLISLIFQPMFIAKYIQFLTIPLFLIIVAFVARYEYTGLKRFIPFLIIIPFTLSFKPVPDVNRNTDELMAYIKEIKHDDSVFYCPPHYGLTLSYHYNQDVFEDYENTSSRMVEAGFKPIYASDAISVNAPSRLIFIDFDSEMLYPNNGILPFLEEYYNMNEVQSFKGNFSVYTFDNY